MDQSAGVSLVMQQKAPGREYGLHYQAWETVSGSQATQQYVDQDIKWGSTDNGFYDSQIRQECKDGARDVDNH